jgi:RNA polymerase sigma-70 factor (ECF subfamily)
VERNGEIMSLTKTEYASAYTSGYKKTICFLVSRGIPECDAEDAAQAAWAKGWERRENLRRPEKLLLWINSIALNLFRNRYRRDSKLDQLPAKEIAVPAERIASRIDLEKGLRRCSRSERLMLRQLYLAGFSSKELGRQWNLKAGAVRVRIHRTKQKLRGFFAYGQYSALPSNSNG